MTQSGSFVQNGGPPNSFEGVVDLRNGYSRIQLVVGPATFLQGYDGTQWDQQNGVLAIVSLPSLRRRCRDAGLPEQLRVLSPRSAIDVQVGTRGERRRAAGLRFARRASGRLSCRSLLRRILVSSREDRRADGARYRHDDELRFSGRAGRASGNARGGRQRVGHHVGHDAQDDPVFDEPRTQCDCASVLRFAWHSRSARIDSIR